MRLSIERRNEISFAILSKLGLHMPHLKPENAFKILVESFYENRYMACKDNIKDVLHGHHVCLGYNEAKQFADILKKNILDFGKKRLGGTSI